MIAVKKLRKEEAKEEGGGGRGRIKCRRLTPGL